MANLLCNTDCSRALLSCVSSRSDRADHRRLGREYLLSDFTPMHVNLARKRKGQANPISLDSGDAHYPDWVCRIANNDFFPFPPCDNKHVQDLLPYCCIWTARACAFPTRHKRTRLYRFAKMNFRFSENERGGDGTMFGDEI